MPMPFIELLKARRASRAVSPDPLDEKTVSALVEAARFAPSCYNKQPWRYLFMTSPGALEKARSALAKGNSWALAAPLLVAAYSKPSGDCVLPDGRSYHQFDVGMSVMNLMLQATELGLVARPMAGFKPQAVHDAFGLDPDDQVIIMIAVGRPGDEASLPEKMRNLDDAPRQRLAPSQMARIL
ncbi:MAG: nitroreductase family protein [Planctomycetes bacterium]|nr:nitroreductase family protein [Planctomycetota bacterium]